MSTSETPVTVQIANSEVELWALLYLARFGNVEILPGEPDTIYFQPHKPPESMEQLGMLLRAVAILRPDEVSCDNARIRLWWD